MKYLMYDIRKVNVHMLMSVYVYVCVYANDRFRWI